MIGEHMRAAESGALDRSLVDEQTIAVQGTNVDEGALLKGGLGAVLLPAKIDTLIAKGNFEGAQTLLFEANTGVSPMNQQASVFKIFEALMMQSPEQALTFFNRCKGGIMLYEGTIGRCIGLYLLSLLEAGLPQNEKTVIEKADEMAGSRIYSTETKAAIVSVLAKRFPQAALAFSRAIRTSYEERNRTLFAVAEGEVLTGTMVSYDPTDPDETWTATGGRAFMQSEMSGGTLAEVQPGPERIKNTFTMLAFERAVKNENWNRVLELLNRIPEERIVTLIDSLLSQNPPEAVKIFTAVPGIYRTRISNKLFAKCRDVSSYERLVNFWMLAGLEVPDDKVCVALGAVSSQDTPKSELAAFFAFVLAGKYSPSNKSRASFQLFRVRVEEGDSASSRALLAMYGASWDERWIPFAQRAIFAERIFALIQ